MPTEHLTPFVKGDPRNRELGRRGGETRAANARARAGLGAGEASAMREALERVTEAFKRDELGEQAAAVAGLLLGRIAAGAIVVKGPDVAALLRVLVDVARLEAGEPTSASVVAHVSTREALERVALLREQARSTLVAIDANATIGALSAAAVAVEDAGTGGVGEGVGDSGGVCDPAGLIARGGAGDGGVAGPANASGGPAGAPPPPGEGHPPT